MIVNHLEFRQHPQSFVESHEGNWTAEQPGHRQGGDEQGEEMVADDVKNGSIPIRSVNQAKAEEQKHVEKMKVLEVVDRREASGSEVIKTRWVVTNKGAPEKPNRLCSMGGTGIQMDGCSRQRILRSNSWTGTGEGCTTSGVHTLDAESLPKTFVELLDCYDLDTGTSCCWRLKCCLYWTRQVAVSWQRAIEKGIYAAGMVMGKMSKCSFKSPCGARRRQLARRTEVSLRKGCKTREQRNGSETN